LLLSAACAPQLAAAPVQAPVRTSRPTTQSLTALSANAHYTHEGHDGNGELEYGQLALSLGWLPSRGKECVRRGPNRGFCSGPRRVPQPFGEAAHLAAELGLGERASSARLLLAPPSRDWVTAAKVVQSGSWVWPVDPKGFVRGPGNLRVAAKRRRAMAMPHPDPKVAYPPHHEHEGVDWAAPVGTPIRAAQGGLVAYSDNELRGYGNLVMIVHPDGAVTVYAHCRATFVFPGQHVSAGQVIGEVGNTGFSRGPHLHFEYRVGGMPRDPQPHLWKSHKQRRALAKKLERDHHVARTQPSLRLTSSPL
jgi:murein DD-endopeptidase MepM/ murein hydrolase activator NlpD